MAMKQEYDIAIVGGGIIGSALAAALMANNRCAGLRVALIDAAPELPAASVVCGQFDPRVVALSNASRSLLQQAGVWADIVAERACPYLHMHVWDAEGTGNIQFNSNELQRDSLGHIVENSVLQRALRARLARGDGYAQVDVCTAKVVESITAPVTDQFGNASGPTQLHFVSGETVRAQLVLAVDGANSSLREMAGLTTREWEYGHTAIVTTVRTEQPHNFTAWQRFTQQGPIAFLPLCDNPEGEHVSADDLASKVANFCSLVWSVESNKAEALMALTEQEFCAQLSREFEYKLGAVEWADKRVAIALKQRHAKTYFVPGLALVGDAAHTIHPLAGLGANLGLADASILVNEIARACERKLPLTDTSILRRYQRQRQGENLGVMATMEGFKRLFAADDPAIRWARNSGMRWLNNAGWLKNKMVSIIAG